MLKHALRLTALLLTITTAQAAEWGSIAFSPSTGATGYSHNYDTRNTAGEWAISYCDANDCRIVVNFQNACGAVAVGRNGGWGSDWGTTRANAEANAIVACRTHDSGCRTKRWVCSK